MSRLVWLKWRLADDGRVEIVETVEGHEGPERRRNDAASLDEAARRYGPDFRELVDRAVESGSRKGRYRP